MYRYVRSSTDSSIQWTHHDERTWDEKESKYDFGTFYVNGKQFSVTHYIVNEKIPEFENTWFVKSVHPYDNTEYHWAKFPNIRHTVQSYVKTRLQVHLTHLQSFFL